jgi:hypothetical protein
MFLIISNDRQNNIHHKNKEGLEMILKYLKMEYKYGKEEDIDDDKYKIIYSPDRPVNYNKHPNKLYIFGPHFCVLPDKNLYSINIKRDNVVYILPSQWCIDFYKNNYDLVLNLAPFPFPVNIDKFSPDENEDSYNNKNKTQILIYYKARKSEELSFLINKLTQFKFNINDIIIYNYGNKYNENDFIMDIRKSRFGIVLDAHESQGFAIEEMLSSNLPLFVWGVTNLNQEEGIEYPPYPATTIPYWDSRCGEVFHDSRDFDKTFNIFLSKLDSYKPRDYIVENLSVKPCAERLQRLIEGRYQ